MNQSLNQIKSPVVEIKYHNGTLIIKELKAIGLSKIFPWIVWDARSKYFRCHAYKYRELVHFLYLNKFDYTDFTPNYNKLKLSIKTSFTPFEYQTEALNFWHPSKRGIVLLPTGTGKSYLGALMIQKMQRSALIIAPTIDLINQWQTTLAEWFDGSIGLLGGGSYEICDITVSTYDSARIHANHLGNRFGMIIFDECHHLPSPAYAEMARSYIAPFRLGLTATLNEEDDKRLLLHELLGNVVYNKEIQQLSGEFLAPYTVKSIEVELTAKEREQYDHHRSLYLTFRDQTPGQYSQSTSWEKFVMYCYRTAEGRKALQSFAIQKQIAIAAQKKMEALADILIKHKQERILIFTNDNKTAYMISSLFLLPLITHETKAKERKQILKNFRSGAWPFLVSSRVLNEGVDVPEANIAVVVSGTSTVKEHVQRLGRILRKKEGKKATLYELITVDTGEIYTSRKRREHGAYENI